MATKAPVSRETLQDRLRMASTDARRDVDGHAITSSRDVRRLADSIANLATRIVEDGLYGDAELDAFSVFHNAILFDIDRQLVDFADKIENEVRPARWAENENRA